MTEPSFWRALRGALFAPRALFADTRELTALGAPVRFAAGMGLFKGLLVSAYTAFFVMLLRGSELFPAKGSGDWELARGVAVNLVVFPVAVTVGAFAYGVLVQAVALLSGGRPGYARSVRVAAYASGPQVLAGVCLYVMQLLGMFSRSPLASWGLWLVVLAWVSWVVAEGVAVLHGGRRAVALPVAAAALAGASMAIARAYPPLAFAVRAALRQVASAL